MGRDTLLLAYEHIRMIDIVNSWAAGTHKAYQSDFKANFHMNNLVHTLIERPPSSSAIALMGAQQHYAVRPASALMDAELMSTLV
jgi:hypothetical protein